MASTPVTVTTRMEDNFALLEVRGPLTLSPSLSAVREAAKQALNNPRLHGVILEVGSVPVTDSSGLGELTVVYSLTIKRGCPVCLVATGPHLKRMLNMTRIDELLPSFQNTAEAIRWMMKSRREKN